MTGKQRYHNYVARIQDLYNARVITGPDEISNVVHEGWCESQQRARPGICECNVQIGITKQSLPLRFVQPPWLRLGVFRAAPGSLDRSSPVTK